MASKGQNKAPPAPSQSQKSGRRSLSSLPWVHMKRKYEESGGRITVSGIGSGRAGRITSHTTTASSTDANRSSGSSDRGSSRDGASGEDDLVLLPLRRLPAMSKVSLLSTTSPTPMPNSKTRRRKAMRGDFPTDRRTSGVPQPSKKTSVSSRRGSWRGQSAAEEGRLHLPPIEGGVDRLRGSLHSNASFDGAPVDSVLRISKQLSFMSPLLEPHRYSLENKHSITLGFERPTAIVYNKKKGFPTRSKYIGGWGPYRNFEEYGNHTMPHKVEYEGQFQDGMCHGLGALRYPNRAVVRGHWDHGHLIHTYYTSDDGADFDTEGSYCKMPDRRFYTEIMNGLRPAGRSQLTNKHPPRMVPDGCYDAGDGIFDPRKNFIYDPVTEEVIRVPTAQEMEWIKTYCRKGWDENVGYRPDLFENWAEEEVPSPIAEEELMEEAEEEARSKLEEEEVEAEEEEPRAKEEEVEKVEEEERISELEEALEEEEELVEEKYPPLFYEDVYMDAPQLLDVSGMLFPETEEEPKAEGEPKTVSEMLFVPVDTSVTSEMLLLKKRMLDEAEEERVKAPVEVPKEDTELKVEEPTLPGTPRLSLEVSDTDVYKGPWRHVARRLVPKLRQRLEEDRRVAVTKWQEDLMQLLTERASQHGLEMSTTGYLGAAATATAATAATTHRRSTRVIFPPGLEERARKRRAEREERELEEQARKAAEEEAKAAAKLSQAAGDLSRGTSWESMDDEQRYLLHASQITAVGRRVSILPTTAQTEPKGGRSLSEGTDGDTKSKQLSFQHDELQEQIQDHHKHHGARQDAQKKMQGNGDDLDEPDVDGDDD